MCDVCQKAEKSRSDSIESSSSCRRGKTKRVDGPLEGARRDSLLFVGFELFKQHLEGLHRDMIAKLQRKKPIIKL